jgi:hypothetical protein
MSYSSLIQTLPEAWRSSHGLAALSSVGIHGLLLLALPLLPLGSQKIQLQQSIGLVELTPEEQSRLPQVGIEQAPIPPSTTGQSELPPLPSSQVFQSDVLPPLPPPPPLLPPPGSTSPYQYPISNSLPQSPISPIQVPLPPPPQNNQSLISQNPFGELPEPEPNPNLQVRELSPSPPQSVPPNPNLPSTNGLKPSEPFSVSANQPNSIPQQNTNQSQNQAAINNRANQQTSPPAPSTLPERTKQELVARRNAISRERLATNRSVNPNSERTQRLAAALQRRQQQPSDRTPSNPQAVTPNIDRTQRLAALQRRQQQPSDRTPTNPQAVTPNIDRTERLAALQQRLRQPSASTPSRPVSAETAQTLAQLDAIKERQQAYPTARIQAPIRGKVNTCNKQLDGGVAVLAAVINPAGKIISGPELISNNSKTALRQDAVDYVRSYRFPKTEYPTNQTFRLEFQYNSSSCPVTNKKPQSKS